MSRYALATLLVLLFVISLQPQAQTELPEYRIGFLEGGEYPQFDALRGAYRTEILQMADGKFAVSFPATGYRSAAWNRDSCKVYAQQLAKSDKIDLIVALGPWSVFDLLAAGCTKPIIAAHQFDPIGAGLLTNDGKPIAPNLALTFDPTRIERELSYIIELLPGKKLGLLYFPSGSEHDSTVARVTRMVDSLGGEIVSTEGFDNVGTYAFFKAYQQLKGKVGAMYVTPTFGLTTIKTSPFFEMALRDKVPTVSSAGRFHVTRGAMIGLGSDNLLAEGYYNAYQTLKIMEGVKPAELPVAYQQVPVISLNQSSLAQIGIELPRPLLKLADLFGGRPTGNATHLDFPTALAHGIAASPSIEAINAKLRVIEAEGSSNKAGFLPSLDLIGQLGWQGDNAVDNSYGEGKKSYRSLGLHLSQPLIDFGRWAKAKEGTASVVAAQYEQEGVARLVEEGVILAYYELGRLQEVRSLVTDQRRRIDLYAELAQAREQAGEEDRSERVRWQIERLKLSQEMIDLESAESVARKVLSLLSGHGWSEEIVIDSTLTEKAELVNEYALALPFIGTDSDVNRALMKLTQMAVENDATLMQARADREFISAQTKTVRARKWPQVNFDASLIWRDSLAQLSNGFDESSPFWSAGLKLNWGLFDLFTRRPQERLARASFDQAGFEMDSRQLEVTRAVTGLAEAWLASLDKLPITDERASQTSLYLDGMTEKYLTGQIPFGAIKDGLDVWVEASLADINERFAYYRLSARLMRTLGGSSLDRGHSPGKVVIDLLSR